MTKVSSCQNPLVTTLRPVNHCANRFRYVFGYTGYINHYRNNPVLNSEIKTLAALTTSLFWCIIFTLSALSWCLDYLLWDKAEALQYLAMSFVSDAAAMLVTGALLILVSVQN